MCTDEIDRIYVSISYLSKDKNVVSVLHGIKDRTGDSRNEILFKKEISLAKMSMYVPSNVSLHYHTHNSNAFKFQKMTWKINDSQKYENINNDRKKLQESNIWGLETNLEILVEIDPVNGSAISSRNISKILGKRAIITSDIMVSRKHYEASKEVLIFGVMKVSFDESQVFAELCSRLGVADNSTCYMVQLDDMEVSWMVESPKDMKIMGQIAGVQNRLYGSNGLKDLLVAFSGNSILSNIFGVW